MNYPTPKIGYCLRSIVSLNLLCLVISILNSVFLLVQFFSNKGLVLESRIGGYTMVVSQNRFLDFIEK
jgi:hypothetical protein